MVVAIVVVSNLTELYNPHTQERAHHLSSRYLMPGAFSLYPATCISLLLIMKDRRRPACEIRWEYEGYARRQE
jgi:hypothetical protein